jgi:hypothetical protein
MPLPQCCIALKALPPTNQSIPFKPSLTRLKAWQNRNKFFARVYLELPPSSSHGVLFPPEPHEPGLLCPHSHQHSILVNPHQNCHLNLVLSFWAFSSLPNQVQRFLHHIIKYSHSNNPLLGSSFLFLSFFTGTGVGTQGFVLAKQVLYHLSDTSSPFCSG